MADPEKFLTLTDAAEFLKVSKSSLRRWSNSGYLKSYRIGVRAERRFLKSDLVSYVRNRTAETAKPTDVAKHICTNFKDRTEQWLLLRHYVTKHLNDNSAIVYLFKGNGTRVVNWFAEYDPVNAMIDDDRLRIIPVEDSYLVNGYFDLKRMLDFWRVTIEEYQRRQIKRLLLTGEMDWITLNAPGSELLIEYEKQLDQFLYMYPNVTVVCQYGLKKIPATTIFDSVCLHPTVLPNPV